MADVSRDRVDRGQLFVVGALVIATLLVVLALFLNSGIYSENLAARNADPGVDDAVEYRGTTVEMVQTSMRYERTTNIGNSSYENITANHTAGVETFSNGSRLHAAYRGELRSTKLTSQTNGTWIAQNTTGTYTDAQGDVNWTVTEGVTQARNLSFFVEEDSLTDLSGAVLGQPEFTITFTGGSETYRVVFYDADSTGPNVAVDIDTPTGVKSCDTDVPVGTALYEVDFVNGSIAGASCDELAFLPDISGPYSITFQYSDEAEGQFGMIVDGEYNDTTSFTNSTQANYGSVGSSDPWRSRAIYQTTVDLTYRSDRVSYNETVRVAPGEPS